MSPAVSGDLTLSENKTLTIAAGATTSTGTVTLTAQDNNLDATDKTFTVSADASGGGVADPSALTLTITDDDAAPTVSVADAAAVTEGNSGTKNMSFTVSLSAASGKAITVPYTLTGTATGGSDYETPATTSLSIPAGNASGTIVIKVKGDTTDEPNETIIVTLGAPTHATVSSAQGAGTATGTITDDDGTPAVTLKLTPTSISENGGSSTVTATLSGASSQAVTLTVAVQAVSPAVSGDLTLSENNTLTIAAGATDSTGTVTLTAQNNDVDAANKTFTISANATGGNGVDDPATTTLTITDDDTRGISVSPVTLTLEEVDDPLTENISENQKTYKVKLDSKPTGTVTVNLSSGDTKIATISDTSLEFTPSDWDAQTVTVTAVADALDNAGDVRTVQITHTVSAAGTDYEDESAQAVDVTVTDDDGAPTLSIDSPSVTEGDSSTTTMTFKVTLSAASGKSVSVDYADAATGTATSATDYAAITAGTLTFTAGQTEKTVNVTVNGDTTDEPNETVVVRLSSPSNVTLFGGEQTLDGTGTITDDDTSTVALKLSSNSITENGGSSTVTATLSGTSSQAVTLTVATAAVSPAADGDTTLSANKTLTIAAGETTSSGVVTVTAVDNDVDATNKTFTISAAATGGNGIKSPTDVTLTVTDDDIRGVTVVGGPLSMAEADNSETDKKEHQGSYTVVLDSKPTDDVQINITVPDMVTVSTEQLSFTSSNWNQAQTVTATAVNDDFDNTGDVRNGNIKHTVVAGSSDYTGVAAANVAVTVNDDDGEPALSIDSPSVAEGNSGTRTMTFKVTLSPASGKAVSVDYADATTGTATSATDYAAITAGTLNFAAGQTEKTVSVTVNGDELDEPNETIVLRLSSPNNAALSGGNQTLDGIGTITDDDAAPTVSVADAAAVTEGNSGTKNMSFTVSVSAASGKAITVPYTLTGTASGGSDYETPSDTSLSIPVGDTSGTIVIKVKGDTIDEPNETIIVALGAPTHATVSSTQGAGSATGTITDDDGTPAVTLKLTPTSISENGDSSTVTATLSSTSSQAVTLTVAVAAVSPAADGDITLSANKTLTIPAGATTSTGTVTLTARNNNLDAADKTFTVSATANGGGVADPSAVTLTVTDDDAAPAVSVSDANAVTEGDNPNTTVDMSFTVALDAASGKDVAVSYTLSGTASADEDYIDPNPKSVKIAAGTTSGTIVIKVKGDTSDEPNETIIATLSSPTNTTISSVEGAGTGTGTITDDDATPTVTLKLSSVSITENGGTSTVTASLSGTSSQVVTLTVGATAVSPAVTGDLTLSANKTLTIAAGATTSSGTVTLTAVDNDVDAANKTFTISGDASGGNGVGDPANTTLTITNDDTRGVTVTGGPLSMAEVDNTETEEKEHQSSYTVVLDSEPTHNVQVNISAPSMVTVSPTQLTFTSTNWNQAQTVTVTAVNDTADNPGDVRTSYITHAVVAGSSDYTNVSAARVAVTVNDDDGEPALSIDSPSVTEGDNGTRTMTFKVTLAPASGKAVSVDYADANTGTATSATDYATITAGTLNFAAGQTEKTVSVTVNGDELDEPNETIVLRLSSPSNAALSGGKATLDGTGTITDDDATPTVALKLSSSSITENGGSSTVSATLSGTSSQAVTLTVATTPVDQAVAGDLTLSTNKTLTIAAGATTSTGTVTLTAADNDVDAPNKTFTVSADTSGGNNVANPDSVALTITDDDTRGISVSPVVLTLDEVDNPETLNISEHQKTYTVALDSEPTGTVTVNVSSGDTNIATVSDTSLEFTPSDWGAQTVTVTAVDDDVDNTGDARTVRITHTVSAAGTDYEDESAANVDVTVTDDDGAPTLSIDSPSITEGNNGTQTMTFTVTLSAASGKPVSVDYADAGIGTATSATDYAAITSGTLTFTAGQTEKTVNVTVNGDTTDEPNETVVVSLSSPSNAALSGGKTTLDGTGTINDDDAEPTVSVADASAVDEGNSGTVNMNFTVRLSAVSAKAITVPYTLTGTATGGSDYETPASTSLSIPAGDTSGTIVIKVKGDTLDEPNETIIVTLGSPTHATVSSTQGAGTASGTINDDDAAPSVSIANAAAVNEGNDPKITANMSFTVSVSAASAKKITVPYTLTGTATGGSDYETPLTTSLSIPAGDTSGTIVIKVKGDTLDEPNETVIVTLSAPTHATVSNTEGAGTGTGTINDDDATPTVTLKLSSVSITENGGTSTVTASLSGTSSQVVTLTVGATAVSPAVAGDLTLSANKTLTIAAGATTSSGTVTLTAVDNDVDALNKTFTVSADASGSNGVGDPANTTLTITDDDTRGVTVSGGPLSMAEVDNTETEEKEHQSSYTVVLDSEPTHNVQVNISAPSMVTVSPTQLTFTTSNWDVAQSVTVTAVNDDIDNAGDLRTGDITHAVVAGGSDYTGETADKVAVTVTDDDGEPALSINSPTITEGNNGTQTMTFTVTLSAASGKAVSVDYADAATGTATSATDYAAITSGTLTFTAGQTEKTVAVTVNGDTTDEPNETVVLRLSSPVNAGLSGGKATLDGTGTINDDDAEPTVSVADASAVNEGNSGTVNMNFTVSLSAASAKTITVPYTLTGTATGGSDYETPASTSLSIPAGSESGTIVIKVKGDTLDEPNETIIVTLNAPTHATVSSTEGAGTGTGTITDDDGTPTATLVLSSASITENGGTSTVTATMNGTSSHAITLTVATAAMSPAIAGDIKLSTNSTLTIAAGATTSTGAVTITAKDNDVDAPNKTFTVSANTSGDSGVANPANKTLTITDDDTRGISVSPVALTLAEVDDPLTQNTSEHQKTYTVELDSEPTGTVTVNLSSGDTKIATVNDTSLEFTASDWDAQTVTVTAVADTTDNASDARTVRITHTVSATGTDYEDESAQAVDVTVTDDDSEPTLSIDSPSINEGDSGTKTMTFKVALSPASGKPVSVAYADATTGTATSATDYAAITAGTLNFAAGETEKTVSVTVNGDELDEPNETVVVRLSSPSNAALSGGNQTLDGTGTINDDDGAPILSVANASAVDEGNSGTVNMSFTVRLSAASGQKITVPYSLTGTASSGSDYETPSTTSLSIPAGDTSGTIIIKVKGDTVEEPDETIIITLNTPTNATVSSTEGTGNGTINDDDGTTPVVALVLSPSTIDEKGSTNSSTVTATLNSPSSQAITLTVATTPVDPAVADDLTLSANKILTIAAGETTSTGTVTITAVDNDVDATNKTFTVSADASGGNGIADPATATLTITDDDTRGATVTGGPLSMAEADNSDTTDKENQDSYTVVLDSEPTNNVSIDITAPNLVTLSTTRLTFTPSNWNQAQTVTVTAVDDTIDNPNDIRTGIITHVVDAGDSNYTDVSVSDVAVTVNDDDATPGGITLSVDKTTIAEDAATETVIVTATINGTATFSVDTTVTVSVGVDGDTATEGADYVEVGDFDIVILVGDTSASKPFTLEPMDDALHEETENLSIVGESGDLTINGTAIDITDNDDSPIVSINLSPSSISENGGQSTVTASLNTATHSDVVLTVATVPVSPATANDFTLSENTTLTISAGSQSSSGTVTITANDNTEVTSDKLITVSATTNSEDVPNPNDQTLTLENDDTVSTKVSLSVSPDTVFENGGATNVSVTATLADESRFETNQTIVITVGNAGDSALSGTDYDEVSSFNIVIEAGNASGTKEFELTPIDDTVYEGKEQITITGTNDSMTVTPGSLSITDNDVAAILSVSPAIINESAGATQVTVTATVNGAPRSQATPLTISVDPGTAEVEDYVAVEDFILTIPAQATSAETTFTFTPVDDVGDESDESVIVSGTSNIEGYTVTPAALLIQNMDDRADPIKLTVTPAKVAEAGGDQIVTIKAEFVGDGAVHEETIVEINVSSGTAIESVDFIPVKEDIQITIPRMMDGGETTFTFTPVNDAVEDPDETVKVSGVAIVPNDDNMKVEQVIPTTMNISEDTSDLSPKEWLARFGRTVTEQVLDAIDSRMHAQRTSGFELNLAGVNLNPLLTDDSEEHYSQESGTEHNDFMSPGGHSADTTSPRNGINLQSGIDPQSGHTSEIRSVTQEDLLMGSSFSIELGDTQEGHFALWGRATRSNFDGRGGGLVLDGEVTSVLLGADWSQGDISAGLIAGKTRGEGGYQSEKDSGKITADMTGVYPWARFELSERISVWGTAGAGDGTLTVTPSGEEGVAQTTMRTDLEFAMAAAGVRGILIEAPDSGGFELAVKADVMNMNATTAKVKGLAAADVEVSRFRLGLEGSQPIQLEDDALLILNFELGARHDDGDAETGFGVDVGAGIAWTDPKRGLSADLRGRALVSHESDEFRNVGISAMFSWNNTSEKGRGPQLTISQTMGSSSDGGMNALLERQTLDGLVADDSQEGLDDQRLETVFSYGFSTFDDDYTLTPRIGYAESAGQQDYRVGWKLTRAVTHSWTFELGYEEAWHKSSTGNSEPESTVGLQFGMQW